MNIIRTAIHCDQCDKVIATLFMSSNNFISAATIKCEDCVNHKTKLNLVKEQDNVVYLNFKGE